MGWLWSLLGSLFKTLLIRVPFGIWLGVLCGAGWLLVERQFNADYPLSPITTAWPPAAVNSAAPENPSRWPQLTELFASVSNANLGLSAADVQFGNVGYGIVLGALFGLVIAGPIGLWITLRRYRGVLLFPIRLLVVLASYVALFGLVGGSLAHFFGQQAITTAYAAAFGFALPLLVPLPFFLLRPLFPGAAARQADILLRRARKTARTSLADIARHDPAIGNVTKGKKQAEWDYYGTVCGVFVGALLAEQQGVAAWKRAAVERRVRKRLNKLFEKGEHGLTAVMQFAQEQLHRGAKYTTEVLVGLWLAMQMKGDLNPQRDREVGSALGGQLVNSQRGGWRRKSRVLALVSVIILWAGVAGIVFAAREPQLVEQQLAQLGIDVGPAKVKGEGSNAENPPVAADPADNPASESTPEKKDPTVADDTSPPAVNDPASESTPATSPGDTENTADATDSSPGPPEPDPNATIPDDEPMTRPTPVTTPTKEEPPPDTPPSDETTTLKTEPALRTWTHASGKQIMATALGYAAGQVELQRADGAKAKLGLESLSQSDRQFVYERFAEREEDSPAAGQLLIRTWTNRANQKQVEAALVQATGESAQLMRSDGRLVAFPVAQLSDEDQEFLKELAAASGDEP